ncbi:MAG: amidase [Candidatus Melainabacteria bacterium HGW-Melainabacteria-1]|nr:MAG: amidase [Candidatus Melainabacteria bacterium HGW-Melainabacteria-1]
MNDEALVIAGRLDEERRHGSVRGPLHGIPILIKGNIDTGDALPTTAGSLALKGRLAPEDAPLVAGLRRAGAVILGKTNLSEWANFRSTHSSSGWSSEGGQTKNPYALDRNPSGSSSGSAVAVSANLCAAAVGTETDGSIISPSSVNGIVGIKPTIGAMSAQGIVPLSFSQDTAGPMARTVRDAALLLAAMANPGTMPIFLPPAGAESRDLRGLRLGVARNFCGFLPAVDGVFEEALRALRELGATAVEMRLEAEKAFDEAELDVMLYEFKHGIAEYLGRGSRNPSPSAARSLDDLIGFNRAHSAKVMPWFGQELFEMAAAKGGLGDEAYLKARALCVSASREGGIDAALQRDRLDAILAPSGSPAWKTDHVLGDHYMGGGCTSLPAAAGYPHISLPAGFIHGLPVGLSIFGPKYSEATLIRIASAFESATKVRRPPRFEASAD